MSASASDALAALAGMDERIAHEADAAALPGRLQDIGYSSLQALVRVGHDEFTPRRPRRRRLRRNSVQKVLASDRADIKAENLAPPVGVYADCDDRRQRDDAAVLPRLYIGGADPPVGPIPFERPIEKGFDLLVDFIPMELTWLFDGPLRLIALTRLSTKRVESPWMYAA